MITVPECTPDLLRSLFLFEALTDDYRLSALWQIATPMWQANHGIPPWIWWNHLERSMAAVHDLGCLELLD